MRGGRSWVGTVRAEWSVVEATRLAKRAQKDGNHALFFEIRDALLGDLAGYLGHHRWLLHDRQSHRLRANVRRAADVSRGGPGRAALQRSLRRQGRQSQAAR